MTDFIQYLVLLLIGLLFAKDYLLPPLLAKFGLKNSKNGNGNHRIEDLEKHAEVANNEMHEVKERLVAIETKLDIMINHLKI